MYLSTLMTGRKNLAVSKFALSDEKYKKAFEFFKCNFDQIKTVVNSRADGQ